MAPSWNTAILDHLFAPCISDFTSIDAPDLSPRFPEATHWLSNHFLNSQFRGAFKGRFRQYALNQLYRAQSAFLDYHEARALTLAYFERGRPDSPAARTYFRALARWESCILNLQIFMDILNKMKAEVGDSPVFLTGDNSVEERTYTLANTIKHWGKDIANDRHDDSHTVPVWLTNTGFASLLAHVCYTELAALLSDAATIANGLQDPPTFLNPR